MGIDSGGDPHTVAGNDCPDMSFDMSSDMSNTRPMSSTAKASLPAILLASSLAATGACANPDVWVDTGMIFEFEDHRVAGLTFVWRFDDYYSFRAMRVYDRDRNGVLEPAEAGRLRTESFDPLARFDYYVHVWVAGGKLEGHEVDRFTARIEDKRLVYEFSVPLTPPADPGDGPVTASLFDGETVVDFRFSESDFLLVRGAMKAGCKFRVKRGTGAQSGHPRPVTLTCGG